MIGASARARGLCGRLLSRAQLGDLARAKDLASLARLLAAHGLCAPGSVDADAVERELRAVHGQRLAALGRWCDTPGLLEIVFGDEDLRTVRALLRAGGGPAGRAALAGLVPTPTLPEAALAALSEEQSPQAIASQLALWGHPYARAMLQAAAPAPGQPKPGLAAVEAALVGSWAAGARSNARHGDRILRDHVAFAIDVQNLQALSVSLGKPSATRAEAWLPGGAHLDRATFAAALAEPRDGRGLLRERLAGRPLAELLDADAALELRAVSLQLRRLNRSVREHPLSSAPVLEFALRLRAEALDLRGILWGVALGRSPPAWVTP
jgi:ATP synthase (C/AC39) subunit